MNTAQHRESRAEQMARVLLPPPKSQTSGNGGLAELINQRYDSTMYTPIVSEYYGHSGFHNWGYWTAGTLNQKQASKNLVDVLTGFFPNKNGTILDAACGMGASTKRLLRDYHPSRVTGINISGKQLATCRRNAPGCRFLEMDATRLDFPDNSFDNILCVEAVFHFNTRARFLREAYRVLKPGGCLALSDILIRSRGLATIVERIPLANFVPDIPTYKSVFENAGFEDVRIVQARRQCWEGFRNHSFAYCRAKVLKGEAPPHTLKWVAGSLTLNDWLFSHYLLVSARKPRHRSRSRELR